MLKGAQQMVAELGFNLGPPGSKPERCSLEGKTKAPRPTP